MINRNKDNSIFRLLTLVYFHNTLNQISSGLSVGVLLRRVVIRDEPTKGDPILFLASFIWRKALIQANYIASLI